MKRTSISSRFTTLMLMIAVTFAFTFSFFETDSYAAGNNPTEAESISYGNNVYGTFPQDPKCFEDRSQYFKFKTASVGGVNYIIKAAATDGDLNKGRYSLYLMDYNYNYIKEDGEQTNITFPFLRLRTIGDAGNGTFTNLKPNSTYYIKVELSWLAHDKDQSYAFSVKRQVVKPAAPEIKSVKAGKKGSRKLTVRYNKSKYATRYQIQLKKAGGSWKTYNNGTNLRKLFKNLKKGKKYSVRVRAQRKFDVNGKIRMYKKGKIKMYSFS